MNQPTKYDSAIEVLRRQLDNLESQKRQHQHNKAQAIVALQSADATLERIDKEIIDTRACITTLRNAEQRELLASPHKPPPPHLFHATHRVETRVLMHGDIQTEETFCVPCGAGKQGSMRRPTDPCCMHRDQDDGVLYDELGPVQPLGSDVR